MANDADFFQATYGYDRAGIERTHNTRWIHPVLSDPLMTLNQTSEMLTDAYSGQEAYDYQNPYVWESTKVLSTATLVPAYGIIGDSMENVYRNVTSGPAVLLV